MLTDLLGWYKRNLRKLNTTDKKRALNEINCIKLILEKDLKEGI
jgi:hypothetical protein